MARSSSFWRVCFGWCLLLCILPSVDAATKKVNVPSTSSQVSSGTASVSDGILTMNTAIEGEFIPGPTKNVPVRGIIGGTEFGLNTIVAKSRSLLKGGLAGIAAGVAFDQLLKGLDWVMQDGALMKKQPGQPVPTDPNKGEAWYSSPYGGVYNSVASACQYAAGLRGQTFTSYTFAGGQTYICYGTYPGEEPTSMGSVDRHPGTCPSGSISAIDNSSCNSTAGTYVPLTDSDIDSDFLQNWINNQDSQFVKELLRQSCAGSNNPEGCYQSLRKRQLDLRGPSSVDAGSSTSTTTHKNNDGTTSTTVTNTNTKYNITYSPTTMTYTSHTTTTASTDGKPGDTTDTDDNPADDPDPDESPDDDTTPSPCSGNGCDGPAYTKLYEPTKDTKEKFLDSYASKVKSLPILTAVSGFFTVSASAGCPAWSTNVTFDVFGYSFNTNLVFDFHCQPWFVSMAAYAKIVMSIVCAYLAFRQAILD